MKGKKEQEGIMLLSQKLRTLHCLEVSLMAAPPAGGAGKYCLALTQQEGERDRFWWKAHSPATDTVPLPPFQSTLPCLPALAPCATLAM